jgi:hypothetical protein
MSDSAAYRGPILSMMVVKYQTITPGGTITVSHYGQSRTYYALARPNTYYGGRFTVTGTSNSAAYYESPVLLWE